MELRTYQESPFEQFILARANTHRNGILGRVNRQFWITIHMFGRNLVDGSHISQGYGNCWLL